jgi:hypothetical protein
MNRDWFQPFVSSWPKVWPGALIFFLALTVFSLSHVHQLTDSDYSMLASQSLLDHGTFALEHYALPRQPPMDRGYYISNGLIYQLELANGHILYHLPPGSSTLSVPYVALMNAFGISTTNPDGSYNPRGEGRIEYSLAALLMAALTALFYYTARLVRLSRAWSTLVALAGALGTQVWSTASRGMWSDTWGTVLLGIVVWMLLAQEVSKRQLRPFLLASLLAWLYFVRPTYAVHIFAITVYVLIFYRQIFFRYALTGTVWFIAFVAFSRHYFGRLLPSYYQANRLNFGSFWVALAGNLVSPARGLLVYVPILFFVTYLLVRYRKYVISPRLVALALVVVIGHLIAISGFAHWWGGHSFGARFSTGLVPWFVLLGILGLKAMLTGLEREGSATASVAWKGQLVAGGLLLLLSAFINARGAMSPATWFWNARPKDVDRYPQRLWDWREPQFLAGLVTSPLPKEFNPVTSSIDFSTADADKYLWYGWADREERFRWTDGKEAALVFSLNPVTDIQLNMKLGPFLPKGMVGEQRVYVTLNGQQIETLVLREDKANEYRLLLPKGLLRDRNQLVFGLPDASSPKTLGINKDDPRLLGIAMYWMNLHALEPAAAIHDSDSVRNK